MVKLKRYPHSHFKPLYEVTLSHHLLSIAVASGLAIGLAAMFAHFAHPHNSFNIQQISVGDIALATLNSFSRMGLAFILSLMVSIPLALFMASGPWRLRILLPIADILQSVPVLAFFPVLAAFFVANNAFELASVFVIFLQMVWNIVFPVVGGLQTIPDDVKSAAFVFNVRGPRKLWYITFPALFPFIVTGSLLAWAQGWTIVIVAEVLHTYIQNGTASQDLLGLGSLLVDSSAGGKNGIFLATLLAMILLITLLNLAIWQPLLHLSQKFRFD